MTRSPASAHRGGTHQGSVRDILRRVVEVRLPEHFNPWNRSWRFRREYDERHLRRLSATLRNLADEIDQWLGKGDAT